MKPQHREGLNIPMILACILFCLTLFSVYLMGGLYAKYTASNFAEDSARVAKFDISENGAYFSENLLIESAPGSVKRGLTVVNNSEVAVACIVTIKNTTGNIPYKFSVNESEPMRDACEVTCHLAPGTTENIVISADWAVDGALKYMGMVDLIEITISTEQVD